MKTVGRNDECPCGSGLKYKKCCLTKDYIARDEVTWQRISNAHHSVVRKLIEFTAEEYGSCGYDEAWDEFQLFQFEDPFDPSDPLFPVFGPWMFYHWHPEEDSEVAFEVPPECTPAEFFLEKYQSQLSTLEIESIQESLRRPFSFYSILEVERGWVKVQDLMTGEYFSVQERKGSQCMKPDDLVFGKVLTLRGVSVFDGLAPIAFPPIFKINVIKARERISKSYEISSESLREMDHEMLDVFWDIFEALTNPQLPVLINTDGHRLVPHKLTFSIDDMMKFFEVLHPLHINETREEILERSDRDQSGAIKSIEFPWLKRGNKKHKHWENTVMGHLCLEPQRMTITVNSKERSKNFIRLLKRRKLEGWKLLATVIEDMQSKLEDLQEAEVRENEVNHTDNCPEMEAAIGKMNEGHWKNWSRTALPILGGKTAEEAVKTREGKEMVDALLSDFERSASRNPMPGQTAETFRRIRDQLGM